MSENNLTNDYSLEDLFRNLDLISEPEQEESLNQPEQDKSYLDSIFSNLELDFADQDKQDDAPFNVDSVKFDNKSFLETEDLKITSVTSQELDYDRNRLNFEQEDIKKDPSRTKRMAVKFLEGLSPLPLDYSSGYTEPESTLDTALGYLAYGTGFATSFVGAGFVTGGLKIIGTGAKTVKSLSKASKGFDRLNNINKQIKLAKKSKNTKLVKQKTKQAEAWEARIDNELAKAGVVGNNTLLGRQKFYKELVTRLGSNDYEVGKFMAKVGILEKPSTKVGIQAANALNLGLTNLSGSLLMTQKSIPLRDEEGELNVSKRIYRPILDSMFYTAAGLPRVLSVGGIDKMILNSAKGKALEAGFVYSTGMGASMAGFGIKGEGETTLTDNLIDGAIFSAVHYMGVGADRIQVKEAIKNGLKAVTDDQQVIKKVTNAVSDNALDEIKLYLDTTRPQYLRQRFLDKNNSNKLIQLKGIKQRKVKGGKEKHTLSYQVLKSNDGTSGDTKTIDGLSRKDVLNKFYKEFKNVLPNPKEVQKDYLKKNPHTLKTGIELKKIKSDAYQEHKKLTEKIIKDEEKLGITLNEGSKMRRGGFTKSYGNMERMSIEELNTYSNMLTTKKHATSIRRAQLDNNIPFELPEGFLSDTKSPLGVKKFTGSFQNVLSGFGDDGAWLSKHITDYADTKNIVRGANVDLKNRVKRDFNLNENEYKSLLALEEGDEKISTLIDPDNLKNISDKNLLKKRLRDYFDEHFVELAKYDGKVQVSKDKYEKLLTVIDSKTGKEVEISQDSFNNGDVLKFLRGQRKTLKSKDGKRVSVDLQKTKENSYYVDNYVPHYLSEKAMKLFGKRPEDLSDKIKSMIKQKNPDADENEINTLVKNFMEFSNSKKPFGIVRTRKIDIPPYMVVEKNTNSIIQLGETVNVSKLKKGQTIKDIDNQDRVIGDIIDIYEKDFDTVMDRYSNQIANSIALFRNFDERGVVGGGEIATRIDRIREKYGEDVKSYIVNGFDLALRGQRSSDVTKIGILGGKGAKLLANVYLSGPSASLKNFGAGQTQNLASFKAGEFFKGWGKFILGRGSYDDLTRSVGGITTNVDELALGFKGALSPVSWLSKPFAAVERLNRSASVAITDVSLRDSLQSILKNKKSMYFDNPVQANSALKRVMKMEDDDIKYMIDKLRSSKNKGVGAFDILVESDSKFKDIYKRALYKSQASTQGATQLPYVPTWMADENKKWATLFYRTAYRVTENTYDNVVIPFVTDGNPFPLLKYTVGSALTGYGTYELYYKHALGKDLLGSDFKEVPIKLFDYAVKGEALGIFSNLFDENGSSLAYAPAVVDFTRDVYSLYNNINELTDKSLFADGILQLGTDFTKSKVSVLNQASAFYKRVNNDINLKYQRNKNNRNNFLKTYKQFGGERAESSLAQWVKQSDEYEKKIYFKLLAESLKKADTPKGRARFEKDFLKVRAFLEHQMINDFTRRANNTTRRKVRNQVISNIRTALNYQFRPYPKSWDKVLYGKRMSDFYLSTLTPEMRKEAEELKELYRDRVSKKFRPTKDRTFSVLEEVIRNTINSYDSFEANKRR